MNQIYGVFATLNGTKLVEALYQFADAWSRSSFMDYHRRQLGDLCPINGYFVGQSHDRFIFVEDGWSCYADYVMNEEELTPCWRFSSPLLPDAVYWHIDEFLERVRKEAQLWNMTNKKI